MYYCGMTNIGEIQEHEEWIARLQQEANGIALDIANHRHTLTTYGLNALEYSLQRTIETIAGIRMDSAIALSVEDFEQLQAALLEDEDE